MVYTVYRIDITKIFDIIDMIFILYRNFGILMGLVMLICDCDLYARENNLLKVCLDFLIGGLGRFSYLIFIRIIFYMQLLGIAQVAQYTT